MSSLTAAAAPSPEAASTVMAAVFAYPQDASERRTRIWYALVFIMAKSCALALTFVPPRDDLSHVLLALSIGNLVLSFSMDACARRESKRWAGETGSETAFFHCFLETLLGTWLAHKMCDQASRAWQRLMSRDGEIKLAEDGPTNEGVTSSIFSVKPSPLEEWAQDISWAYTCGMSVKKAIAAVIVALRFVYDQYGQPSSLDIAARVLSSFSSLVLVDVLDGLAKEESRLRSKPVRQGIMSKMLGIFG